MLKKWVKRILIGLGVVLILIQFVPYGRDHSNPQARIEPQWDSPKTRELARQACFNCHSNETEWPWYSHVAPVSWMLQDHVDEGREHLNFSEWNRVYEDAEEAAEEVEEGEMPLWSYTLTHPEARLDEASKAALIKGLKATLGEKHGE